MGNSNKKPEDYEVVRSYKPEQWVNIQKKQNYEIWQNPNKKIRSEVYPLKKQLKPIDLDHYQLRYNNSADIVKVHNLSIKEDSTLCAKSSNSHVYVQRIPYRLNDISGLTQQQALSVLKSAYSGFNTLSTFYGPVEPYDDLICFNESGKTKVWVNSNLAENGIVKDRQQNPISNFANLNAVYVNKLFDMVENKTQGGAFPPKLKNRFRQFNPKTYFQALNLIQEYATQQRIQIPPTINPRLSASHSNEVGDVKNYSSQVNSYPVAASQNLSWASQTLQQSSQIQNPAVASTFQVRSSYPQQIQSNYNFTPNPLQVSQTQYLQQSTVPQNQVSFRAPDQERSGLSMPLVGSASKIGFGPAVPLNVLNSPRNNISVRPISPTKQFDSPSKIISMQAINKQPSVDVNQPVIQNRNKSIIGSVANLSEVRISEQPRSINIIFDDKASELSKPPSSSRLPQQLVQGGVSLNRNPELISNQQQKFTGGYLQQFSPMQPPQQFVQGQHYNVNPISVGFNYPRPMQYQFSPPIQQVNIPINFTQRQLNQNSIQQRAQIQIQAQAQPQPQPQYQAQLLQQQIQPQAQAQVQVQIQSRPQTQQKQTTQVNQTQVQQISSQVQSQQQSQTNSRPLSEQNRQNLINIAQRQDEVQKNSLSNNQQRLAEAYEDENDGNDQYYNNDGEQNQEFGNQEGEEEGDQGRGDQFNRYQGLVEGQGDEVQRQLEKLQQQKIGDYQNQQTGQYFPFAGTFMGQNNQIKRFDTYEIKQGDLVQINKLEGQKSERQQNNKSVEQNKKTILAQQTKVEQVVQPAKETQPQQVSSESPLQVKQSENSSPSQQNQQKNQIIVQQVDSNKISTQNVNSFGNENVKASSNQYQYQYQYQYQSSIGQHSQQNRIPEDAQYEDIQQYIRNKYKNYIGVQSESSDYKPSSEVSPYYAGFNRVGQVQMASYVQSKYDQISNQQVNFSFRPSIPASQVTIVQNRDEKPVMVSSYQYMRVQQMIGDPQQKQSDRKSSLMADNKRSEKLGNQDDILDVKNMERSLDKKYSSMKSNQQMNIDQVKKDEGDDNDVDVKKLEQHLIRFQQSRVGGPSNHVSGSSVEPRFETSQVSKIQSIDQILANRRRSSMNRGFQYKDQVIISKPYSYQNQSPVNQFGRKSRASKISKQLIDIDEKFNKYVKGGAAINSVSSSSKLILKPKEDNYNYRQFDYQNSSRMATGHFGYADNTRGEKVHESTSSKNYKSNAVITSQTKASKGPSYEELRKFMWS